MFELLLLSAGEPVLRCPLYGQVVSVGGSPANDVSLPDASAPPLLCSFEPTKDGYRVVDRAGKGLSLRGNTAAIHNLKDGDEVSLGRIAARFVRRIVNEEKPSAGLRTGILRTRGDGTLCRVELQLRTGSGETIAIPADGVRIGANDANDLVIDDGFISSYHAHVFPKASRLFVRDLDSTNGSFIGDMRVVEAELQPGAKLRIGQTLLTVIGNESDEFVDEPTGDGPWSLGELATNDPDFARTFQLIRKIAPHDASVCVLGETGTGKELVANALHHLSGRAKGPFIALNCAAIPEALIEAELFGAEKGAYTGADRLRIGAFEAADRGTLFLDEVGELPLDMQAKLLRALESRRVKRVGGNEEFSVDVRVVAATHRDLIARVRSGHFREDLLHRLWVIPIHLAPLRKRKRDILHLASYFASTLSAAGPVKLTPGAETKLTQHPYPGNVRELRNVILRALILKSGDDLDADDIDFLPTTLAQATEAGVVYRRGMTMEDIERASYESALGAYPTAADAARALGVPKSTFHRRLKTFGLLDETDS